MVPRSIAETAVLREPPKSLGRDPRIRRYRKGMKQLWKCEVGHSRVERCGAKMRQTFA
jgi:hypothetical protein